MSKDLGSKPDGYPVNRDLLQAIAQAHEDGAVLGTAQVEWVVAAMVALDKTLAVSFHLIERALAMKSSVEADRGNDVPLIVNEQARNTLARIVRPLSPEDRERLSAALELIQPTQEGA